MPDNTQTPTPHTSSGSLYSATAGGHPGNDSAAVLDSHETARQKRLDRNAKAAAAKAAAKTAALEGPPIPPVDLPPPTMAPLSPEQQDKAAAPDGGSYGDLDPTLVARDPFPADYSPELPGTVVQSEDFDQRRTPRIPVIATVDVTVDTPVGALTLAALEVIQTEVALLIRLPADTPVKLEPAPRARLDIGYGGEVLHVMFPGTAFTHADGGRTLVFINVPAVEAEDDGAE